MSKMNVANLSFSTAWGGLEMSTVKITRLFHEAGHHSVLICQPDTPIARAAKDQGLEFQTVKARHYFAPEAIRFVRRQVENQKLDALFLHSMKDIWHVTPALWGRPKIKLFGFARMFLRGVNKKDFLHRRLYGRLNKMIALSHAQKHLLAECLPVPEDKYVVIPNGVDTVRFQPRPRRNDIRKTWGFEDRHYLFGLIGRLDRQKGSLEFVEAAAEIHNAFPQARFIMVGGNTIGEEEFDRLIHNRLRELNLTEVVKLTDFRKDIPDVMNALDAFVMPSYEENFANVLLEALASGLPSIGTNAGGTPEILAEGRAGLLCAPRSIPSLAETMARLLKEQNLKSILSERARERALTEYDIHRVFKRIESLVSLDQ